MTFKRDKGEKVKAKYRYFVVVKEVNEDKKLIYRSSDILDFEKFLDRTWPEWILLDVYDNRNKINGKGELLGRYSKDNRPTKKHLP